MGFKSRKNMFNENRETKTLINGKVELIAPCSVLKKTHYDAYLPGNKRPFANSVIFTYYHKVSNNEILHIKKLCFIYTCKIFVIVEQRVEQSNRELNS